MKAKNILMTLLLVMGAIAAKASGYPPELALVSQPVMVYNHSSITVYYDVENIGDYTYRGNVYIYLDPDYGYYYAKEYVRVYPGRIKRISIDIPAYTMSPSRGFTIMPYYELDRELYSFTTFEYFEPLRFWWDGPRTERWVVITVPARPRYYHRPGDYRYYYDGFRPPMPPHGHDHGPATPPPPMDPMHHTYSYHHNNGGYPANHFNEGPHSHGSEGVPPPKPENNSNNVAPNATVRPNPNAGSMSSGSNNGNSTPPAPNSGSSNSSVSRPSGNTNSGTTRPASSGSSSGSVSRPSGSTNSGTTRPASSGSSSGSVSRPSGNTSSGTTRPASSGSSSSSVSRPSGNSSSGTTRPASSGSSSVTRPSSSTNGSSARPASTSSSSSTRSSSASSSSRSGSSAGRR